MEQIFSRAASKQNKTTMRNWTMFKIDCQPRQSIPSIVHLRWCTKNVFSILCGVKAHEIKHDHHGLFLLCFHTLLTWFSSPSSCPLYFQYCFIHFEYYVESPTTLDIFAIVVWIGVESTMNRSLYLWNKILKKANDVVVMERNHQSKF